MDVPCRKAQLQRGHETSLVAFSITQAAFILSCMPNLCSLLHHGDICFFDSCLSPPPFPDLAPEVPASSSCAGARLCSCREPAPEVEVPASSCAVAPSAAVVCRAASWDSAETIGYISSSSPLSSSLGKPTEGVSDSPSDGSGSPCAAYSLSAPMAMRLSSGMLF